MRFKRNKKYSPGFGILEVLISGTIIIIILGALVTVARSSLTNAKYMQERAQAVSLAAEAVETVRQIRDTNYIDRLPATKWNTVIGPVSTIIYDPAKTYYIYISTVLLGNGLYLSDVPTGDINIDGTNFNRQITFSNISSAGGQLLTLPPLLPSPAVIVTSDNGFVVKTVVTWAGTGGKSGKVELRELITNSRFVF